MHRSAVRVRAQQCEKFLRTTMRIAKAKEQRIKPQGRQSLWLWVWIAVHKKKVAA